MMIIALIIIYVTCGITYAAWTFAKGKTLYVYDRYEQCNWALICALLWVLFIAYHMVVHVVMWWYDMMLTMFKRVK